jgi:hypothetical protein
MRERRRRLASLALTAAFVLLAVPAGATEPTRGLPSRLRVLVPADEMPEMFSFESKGQPGFERELVEGFCRIHGLALDVVPVRDFDQIIPMLLAGLRAERVDAIVMTVFSRRSTTRISSRVHSSARPRRPRSRCAETTGACSRR